LAGRNFGEFGDSLRICQSFIHQLLEASEIATEAGLKFAKVCSLFWHRYTDNYLGLESFHMSSLTPVQICLPDDFTPLKKVGQ